MYLAQIGIFVPDFFRLCFLGNMTIFADAPVIFLFGHVAETDFFADN